jgi:hypothetical protein
MLVLLLRVALLSSHVLSGGHDLIDDVLSACRPGSSSQDTAMPCSSVRFFSLSGGDHIVSLHFVFDVRGGLDPMVYGSGQNVIDGSGLVGPDG